MRKVKVWVGGGSSGKLVYWAYRICGDKWVVDGLIDNSIRGHGYKFLPRNDRMNVICYLLGLSNALMQLLEEIESGEKANYLILYYCSNVNVFRILSKWGYGIRDSYIIEILSSLRSLVNKIGALDVRRSNSSKIEEKLRIYAAKKFYRSLSQIIKNSRSWDTVERGGYVIYFIAEDSKDIPLSFLAGYLMEIEKKQKWNPDGVIVVRQDGTNSNPITKLFFYNTKRDMELIKILKRLDSGFKGGRIGMMTSLYVTSTPADRIEDTLIEVFKHV